MNYLEVEAADPRGAWADQEASAWADQEAVYDALWDAQMVYYRAIRE